MTNNPTDLRTLLLQFVQQALALDMNEVPDTDEMKPMFAGLRDVMRTAMHAYVDRYTQHYDAAVTAWGPDRNSVEMALTFDGLTKTVRFELQDFLPAAIAQVLDGQKPPAEETERPEPELVVGAPLAASERANRRRTLRIL